MGMKLIAASLVMVTASTGCLRAGVKNPPEYGTDLQVPGFEWRIRTQDQINAEYKRSGKLLYEGDMIVGFTGRVNGKIVVYTTKPVTVDDRITCTLGHEVMHQVLGNYHSKEEAK